MFDLKNYIISGLVLSQFLCGYVGYTYAKDKCAIEISQIREDASAELQTALIKKEEQNNVFREALSTAQSSVGLETEEIYRHFDRLVSVAVSDNLNSDVSVSVSDSQDSASSNTDMPDSSKAASGVQVCTCRDNDRLRRSFKRLRERVLVIGRDCDITKAHYNALIEFNRSISTP